MDSRTEEHKFLGKENEEDFNSPNYDSFLAGIFSFGHISNKTYEVFKGFKVCLRPLTPVENIEVSKEVGKVDDIVTKEQVLKIEVLSRAIININGQALRFPDEDIIEWREFRGIKDNNYKPSEVEQQRHYLKYRFNAPLIGSVYEKYNELLTEQESLFSDLKKK